MHRLEVSAKKDKDAKDISIILEYIGVVPKEVNNKPNSTDLIYIFDTEEERAEVWRKLFWSDKKKIGNIMITEITDYIGNPFVEEKK